MKWLVDLFRRRRLHDDLAEEIRQHLDEKIDELVGRGLARDDAIAAARREFGNVASIEERARDAWGLRWLDDLVADARYGVRQLLRQRGLTAVCLATLALGVGANATVFSALYSAVLRPLPFRDPGRLVLVTETRPGNVAKTGSPFARYEARAAGNTVFEETAGYWDVSGGNGLVFGGGGSAHRLQFSIVTSSFFPLLGIQPALGRPFLASEDAPSPSRVFLASHALWEGQLGADPAAIGRVFELDGESYTLVGVLPPAFHFPGECDVWMPVGSLPARMLRDRVSHQFRTIARLRPATDVRRAQEDLDRIQRALALAYPTTDGDWQVKVTPLLDDLVGDVRTPLWILFAAVALVLLVACANVVNLLLARAVTRQREFAIRGALGASRARLLRQTLVESLILALAALPLALWVATVGLQLIVDLGARNLPRLEQLRLDGPVSWFCAALTIAVTLLVGIAPALHAADFAASAQLQARGGSVAARATRQRGALVVAEVALTLVLLTAAGVLLRSFARLTATDPGFDPRGVVTMKLALPDARYPRPDQRAAFLTRLLGRLAASPGFEGVAAVDRLPLSGDTNWGAINVAGRPQLDAAHAPVVQSRAVSPDYFQALRIRLRRGRPLAAADADGAQRVVVINQTMANQFWPGADPIGQRILSATRPADPGAEVVGVVADVKDAGLAEPSPPEMYTPYRWWNVMNIVVRSRLEEGVLTRTVRAEVAAIDDGVPVYDVSSMESFVRRSAAASRFELWLLGVFAAIALVLSAIGVYGVVAFDVTQRTRDIAVREALGASRGQVMKGVLAGGMRRIALGLAAGVLLAIPALRLLKGLLYQAAPLDPLALLAASAVIAAFGAAACAIPAGRAMRIDPAVALRCE